MKRLILLFSLLALCASALAAQPPRYHLVSNLSLPNDMLLAREKNLWRGKMLRVGIISENTSPYNIIVDDDLYGLNADYLDYIQQVTGIRFEVLGFANLARLQQALQRGEIDLLYGIPRQAVSGPLQLSHPYYASNLRVLRDRNNNRPVMLNSATARVAIGALTDMQAGTALQGVTSQVQRYDNNFQAVYALLNGSDDYFIADDASASFIIDQLQLGQLYQVESAINLGSLSFVFAANDARLIDSLNNAIADTPMELMNSLQSRWSKKIPSYLDTGNADLTPMEKNWVAAHRSVPYAAVENNFPFVYRDADNQPRGYLVDILNTIGQNSGLQFTPVWARNAEQADALVSSGQALMRAALPLTADAKAHYSASMPVHRALWGVYVGRYAENIAGWAALQGKRIGFVQGDLGRSLIPAGNQAIAFSDAKSLYDALANGRVDALVDNVISANFLALSRYSGAIRLAFPANNIAYPIAFGVRPDRPLLLGILDKNLMQIPAETLRSLRETWIVDRSSLIDAVNDNRMPPQTTWLLTLLAIIILLLLLWIVRRYRQQRREQREHRRLEQARRQAEAENRRKSKFLATVSHELRTPMHAILGLLELELKKTPAPAGLPVIYSSAASLLNLLNDLQDYAKLESGSLTLAPKPLALRPWGEHLQALYRPLLGNKALTFRVRLDESLPDAVTIDGERLLQIANNLINNAIKFTTRGYVEVGLAWQDGTLHLSVADSGCGIAADELDKLFQPFYRARGAQRISVQGTGLGLSICKEIVEQMGGAIVLRSQPGVGTQVDVTLPAATAQAITPPPQDAAPARRFSPALRVALIDDHPTNLLLMERQLRHFALQPALFEHGYPLLQAHRQRPFELLFIDYNMPRPDGLTLARLIRRDERRRGLPACHIVLCSADVQEFTRIPAGQVHIDHFLTKPISLAAIEQVLAENSRFTQPQLALTDLKNQLTVLGGDNVAMQQRLASTLRTTLLADRQRLQAAAQRQDWLALGQAAHRIKGSLLMLQLGIPAQRCQQAIDAARRGEFAAEAYTEIDAAVAQLLTQLDAAAPTMND
ncbi:transporter substrate-binding domain-containing protein [Serratia sp. JUb9]|uniref:ATP-binding protein n=1 Tax=Serratia sp. JUb9 TaxID=2724469 RepID=UPI00164E5727|nr:transporter substrate-binding domain-containing protein [Serratia sp. JUb9]QNK31369.1 transporter substrate-binding domain-containing protein [Serratia sp. JUb9]